MNADSAPESLTILHREQTRLRLVLAAILIAAVVAFALVLSNLGRESPLKPLLMVKASLLGLVGVYAVGIGVTAVYSRWIRVRREPLARSLAASKAKR